MIGSLDVTHELNLIIPSHLKLSQIAQLSQFDLDLI